MKHIITTSEVFDGKGVCLQSKGQGIKPLEWCYV